MRSRRSSSSFGGETARSTGPVWQARRYAGTGRRSCSSHYHGPRSPNPADMTRLSKQLAIATALVTVVLFAVGGLVRGTGSGLGCSTWPACEPGHVFPAGAVHSLIEFSHRTLALLVVMLSLLTALVTWRTRRDDRSVLVPALLVFPLTIVQAVIGAIVV